MKFQTWLSTYRGATSENAFHRRAHLLSLIVIVVLALLLVTRDHTVVLVPPELDKRAEVSRKKADENFLTSWGVHVATLLGNVTPSTAPFVGEALGPMLAPDIYRTVLDAVDGQVRQIKEEQVTLSFAPSEAKFDDGTQIVWVTGELITRGVRGAEQRELRTYEMQFRVAEHRVLLASIRVYKGRALDAPPAS